MRNMKDSGIEWIGEIPEDWKRTKLKNLIIESNSGEVIDKSYWNIGNEILYSCSKVTIMCNYSKFPEHKRTVKGDLLLTRNATPYIFIPEENAIYTNVVQRIKLSDKVNLRFIKYMLESSRSSIKGYGDIIESFNMNVWGNTWCTIPSIEEQELIADYLDSKVSQIDNIISKTKETIEEYKKYKQSVITEAVTKGLNPNVEMKDSGIEWIGEIPVDWELTKLKKITKSPLQYGANSSGVEYDSKLPRYIRITDIDKNNELKTEGKLSLQYDEAQQYILKDGDILFARSGGTVGKTFLYKESYGISAFAGYLIKASIIDDILPTYIYYYTLSSSYNEWKNRIFIQATIQNIGADKYSNMEIPIPKNKNEQEAVVEYLDMKCNKIDNIISKKEQLITELEQYKKSLIYECVTGKKEVSLAYAD